VFILKWKGVLPYLKNENINNELKERLKYIHIGKYIDKPHNFRHIPIN